MGNLCDNSSIINSKYPTLTASAYWTHSELNSSMANSDTMLSDDYKVFLNRKYSNPTVADIAMRDVVRKHPVVNPEAYAFQKNMLERDPEVDTLVKSISKKRQAMYPNTKDVRSLLVNSDRFSLDKVLPKATKWEKFLTQLKLILH